MKKYTFISYIVFANNEEEAWENIQESMQQNQIADCFTCAEDKITFDDFKNLNPLGLNKKQLDNLSEENLEEYLEEFES